MINQQFSNQLVKNLWLWMLQFDLFQVLTQMICDPVLNAISVFCVFFQHQTVSLQAVPRIEEVLYHYNPLRVETYGPRVPELEQLGRLGYEPLYMVILSSFNL